MTDGHRAPPFQTELQAEYEQKLELMREDVTNMMKSEVSETDDLLNGLSAALVNHHQQMLSDALTLLTQELEQHLNTNECLKVTFARTHAHRHCSD